MNSVPLENFLVTYTSVAKARFISISVCLSEMFADVFLCDFQSTGSPIFMKLFLYSKKMFVLVKTVTEIKWRPFRISY